MAISIPPSNPGKHDESRDMCLTEYFLQESKKYSVRY
jgi:hypothetical protein